VILLILQAKCDIFEIADYTGDVIETEITD
jgi:hypothetical protein